MWVRQFNMLKRLTILTCAKVYFKWTDVEQNYFIEIKRVVA